MKNLTRRSFLRGAAATTVGAGIGLSPSIGRAAPVWGELSDSGGLPKYKILDIMMPGGASQWESFWVSHDGPGNTPNWRGLESFVMGLDWADLEVAPNAGETHPFEIGPSGNPSLSWGPATKPLWRPDILDRTRMVLTKHDLPIHNLASFLSLTGREFGRPRAASLGASIQRHFQSLPSPILTPYSYVFAPSHLGKAYFQSQAVAIGQHPGSARPLALRVGEPIEGLLTRNGVRPEADAISSRLRNDYQDLLRFEGEGGPIRSAGFGAFEGASRYLENAGDLDSLLGGDALLAEKTFPQAADSTSLLGSVDNPTKRSLELAAKMFDNGARHVTVIDGGLDIIGLRDSQTPYDGHKRDNMNVVEMTSVHLFNLAKSLASTIKDPNDNSFAWDGFKIDLDNTLVRIFTEFGRSPQPTVSGVDTDEYASCGRGHFSDACFQILIGGPVNHRGRQGWVGFKDGNVNSAVAHDALTPTDAYAGMLIAAGVDPFASEGLTTGDNFSDVIRSKGTSPSQIRAQLIERFLGVSSSELGETL